MDWFTFEDVLVVSLKFKSIKQSVCLSVCLCICLFTCLFALSYVYTDLDKIIGTPGIFVSSLTLALNFSLPKPNVFRISFFMDCAIVSM